MITFNIYIYGIIQLYKTRIKTSGPNLKTYTLHLPTNLLTEETFFVEVSTRWLVQLHSSPIPLPPSDGPSTFAPWDFFCWMVDALNIIIRISDDIRELYRFVIHFDC